MAEHQDAAVARTEERVLHGGGIGNGDERH